MWPYQRNTNVEVVQVQMVLGTQNVKNRYESGFKLKTL